MFRGGFRGQCTGQHELCVLRFGDQYRYRQCGFRTPCRWTDGIFFPGPRLEVGGSWQKTLQDDRKNAFGFHMGWQPAKAPLNLRAEFAHSFEGSGYWVEGSYRLSQARFWQKAMRRTEFVARAQQFFVGQIASACRGRSRSSRREHARSRLRSQLLPSRWAERHRQLRPPVQFRGKFQPMELRPCLPLPYSAGPRGGRNEEANELLREDS